MKIANADKLIHHFKTVVDVHLFTPAEIITIINTFSKTVPEDDTISKIALRQAVCDGEEILWENFDDNDKIVRKKYIDEAPDIFGGTRP